MQGHRREALPKINCAPAGMKGSVMSDLVVRKLPFDFEGVDFNWHPANSPFAMMMNAVTFQVIGLETYMCRAMRDAEKFITDPEILHEARAFNAQEMVHSQAHKKHIKALLTRYPGLQEVLDGTVNSYDALYRSESLDFHLSYAANIEATFTPLFGTIINHREALFSGGDSRITALMLWHFCEEIEHRSSALKVYNHVVGNRLFRLKKLPKVIGHIKADAMAIHAGFARHVPDAPEGATKGAFERIPTWPKTKMILGILESQMPWHRPERGHVPPYYNDWQQRYGRGEDMTVAHELSSPLALA
jgi:predicted metal-dependent hydrolase